MWVRTQTRREEHDVEVGEKLLLLSVEVAQSRDDVAGQADADHLHDGFEDEQDQVAERRMRVVPALREEAEGRLHGRGLHGAEASAPERRGVRESHGGKKHR